MNAVAVNNLTFAYRNGKTVLRDVSFTVSAGEVFMITGASGCGKTTLCHILCGIIPHAVIGNLSGQISIMGIYPITAGLPQTALQAGMVFQDAESQIICATVEDEIAFGLENLCWKPEEIRRRVDGLMVEFGFSGLNLTNPSHLSGGQKKLLTIAAVLAPAPPILILDEPFSGLDTDGCELVNAAIAKQRQQGRTVIIAEHDYKKGMFADSYLQIDNGKAV